MNNRTNLLQTEIASLTAEIIEVARKHSAALSALAKNPADTTARMLLTSLSGTLSQLRAEVEGLRMAQAEALAHDQSDARLVEVNAAKTNAIKALRAAAKREEAAAAIDAALASLAQAVKAWNATSSECRAAAYGVVMAASSNDIEDRRLGAPYLLTDAAEGRWALACAIGPCLLDVFEGVSIAPNVVINAHTVAGQATPTVAAEARIATQELSRRLADVADRFNLNFKD